MQSRNDIALRSFYIFNAKFGPKEGEEANKVLFYHPAEIDIDTQIKDVGLSEAIIQFTSKFADQGKPRILHTQKTSQLIYQPEPDYCMVMTLNVPYEEKSKDNTNYREYRGDDVHDKIYHAVVKQCYYNFRLFHDTFAANAVGATLYEEMEAVRTTLKAFFTPHLSKLELKSADILDVFNSIHYFPLSQQRFLRLQIFINRIESEFTAIKHCIFLYDEQIVWSGINPTDLYSLNEYLVNILFPSTRGSLNSNVRSNKTMKFLTGPLAEGSFQEMPKVHIHNSGEPKTVYNLAVYRAMASTICMFIEDSEIVSQPDYFKDIHGFIGPQLVPLTNEIDKDANTPAAPDKSEPVSKYLYFNELNRLHSGTIHMRNTLNDTIKINSTISRELTNLIADLYEERRPAKPDLCQETYLKTHNDFWLVRRTSNYRHFFIVLNKNCTLLETQDEMQRSISANVKNVFF